jgi:hypothetical protein
MLALRRHVLPLRIGQALHCAAARKCQKPSSSASLSWNRCCPSNFSARRLLSSSESSSSSNIPDTPPPKRFQRLRDLWNSGSILLGIGFAGLGLLVVDRYLQYVDDSERSDWVAKFDDLHRLQEQALWNEYEGAPVLYECVVRKTYQPLGGTHGLKHVELNEVLQVIQEHVGPNGDYSLCRKTDGKGNQLGVGWFPASYLERKRRWWQWRSWGRN